MSGNEFPEQHRQLEQAAFDVTQSRLEATHDFATLLARNDASSEARAAWQAVIETHADRLDAKGFDEQRCTNVYHTPGQPDLREDIVFFTNAGQGEAPQMLLDDSTGKPVMFNAELYDLRFMQSKYTVMINEERIFAVPQINSKGAVVRVTLVRTKLSDEDRARQAMPDLG